MRTIAVKKYMQKYGRKALIVYLVWCIIKGIAFLFLGFKLFS